MNKTELDQNFLAEAMNAAAMEVFATMLGCEISPQAPKPDHTVATADYGIISLLGLTGEWTGSAGLSCSAECACWITSQMLFSEYAAINAEVLDAVGEITNMVIGNFKNSIHTMTGPLAMSTPTVICGREMQTTNGGAHEWLVFPFCSAGHSIRLMVQLHQASNRNLREHAGVLAATHWRAAEPA
jgi:chemotaxis protein CheX